MTKLNILLGTTALWALSCITASAGTVTYIYTDPQGTPLEEVDSNGAVKAIFDYRPYGSLSLGSPSDGPGYTEHVNDPDTGLIYMQARYYDPAIGRFLATDPDPLKAGDSFSFSRYFYADGNPIKNMDPNGKATCVDRQCKYSTIDAHPGGPNGPTINFVNDNRHGASPNQPVTTATANMVEHAVIRSGVHSVTINSTTGGSHAPASRHYQKKAVDIDQVNGEGVRQQGASQGVRALQDAFKQESNTRENFGPSRMEKSSATGQRPAAFTDPRTAEDHEGHIHESGQN